MKLIKRSVSVFLAVLMAFSSFAMLANAAATYNWELDTQFYRMQRNADGYIVDADGNVIADENDVLTEGSTPVWIPADGRAAKGESVKARVFMKTDFALAASQFFFFYPTDFLTVDTSNYEIDTGRLYVLPVNDDASTKVGANGFAGTLDVATDMSGMFNNQVEEGFLEESDLTGKGWAFVAIDSSAGGALTLDGTEWLFELDFTVNEDATDVGQFYLSTECVADWDNFMAATVIAAQPTGDGGSFTRKLDAASDVDMGTFAYTLNDTDDDSSLKLTTATITFDANGGQFPDGTAEVSETADIQPMVNATLPENPTIAGGEFLGWVSADIAEPTEADILTASQIKYGYYDTAYKAYYRLENSATIVINYVDATTGLAATKNQTIGSKTGYTVKLVEALPETQEENTTYVTYAELTAIEHYKFDTANASNEFSVVVADDGSSTINIYYVPVDYTATFNPDNGEAATTETKAYYSDITAPAAPEKSGYKFTGWKLDGSDPAEVIAAGATFKLEGNVSYTAQYESAETTVAVEVVYNDLANGGAAKTVSAGTVNTIAGYTVALAEADDGAENKDYFLIENLPSITHYEYDAGNTANVTSVTAAADGSSKLVLYYAPVEYTAVFTGAATITEAYYTEITAPAGPAADGKNFLSWVSGETSLKAGDKVKLEGDITYTADYEDIIYNATYSFDGEAPEDATVPTATSGIMGDEVILPEVTPVTGWTFNGWTVVTGAVERDGKYYYGTSNVTVKGSWTHEVYTATYWLDAAMTEEYDVQEYYYGDIIELLDAPDSSVLPAGKEFVEWDCGYASMPAENINIIATLNPIQYTVTITLPEGDPVTYSAIYGDQITAEELAEYEELEGYTFNGWVINGKAATLPYTITGNTGVRGDFTKNTWDLYFWVDEDAYNAFAAGEATSDDAYKFVADVEYDSAIDTLTPVAPTKEGHTFIAWDMEPTTMEDNDMHFYGTWDVESYKVVWDNDGATTEATYQYGAVLDIPAPTKTGYAFKGWSGLTVAEEGDTTMPDIGDDGDTVTYTAVWEANEYPATFNANGGTFADGTTTKTVQVAYGTAVTAPEVPTRSGYAFGGWAPALGNMDDVNGKTYNATWVADTDISYKIETYTMDVTGAYGEPEVETKAGETDADVSVTPETLEGFTVDTANSVLSGKVAADGSTTLKVYYIREQYTLKTVVDGEETSSTDYYYGAAVTVATPSKEGHSFAWDKAVPATMPAENVTLTGTYTALQYDLVYMVDGQQHSSEKVTYGTNVTVIDPLTKEGYTFSGWDKTGTFTMPAETVTISGTWTVNKHNVIYMVDGQEYQKTEVAYGTEVTVIDALTKEGYTFSGWDKTGTFTMPDEDVTISGTWTANKHNVIYMVDGEEYQKTEVAYGTPVTIIDDLNEDGKVFSGWTIDGAAAADFTMPDKDVTIIGSWTTSNYTVTYYLDSNMKAEEVVYTYTGTYGQEYNIPTPDKTGHTFVAWVNAADATETGLVPGNKTTMPLNGGTYYATWTVDTTKLVYRAGTDATFSDGTATKSYDVAYGTPQADWDVPTETVSRPGYTFKGWDYSGAPATMGTTQVNITAIWEAIPYTVTWINGDAEPVVVNYIYGDEIIAPELEEREGWTFSGWLEADGTTYYSEGDLMGEKSLVYTAQWEGEDGISYTIYRYFAPVEGEEWMDAAEAEAKYGKAGSTVLTGTAGTLAKVDTAAEAVEGFSIDETNSILSATIKGDGTTALVIYYLRDKVNVTVKDPEGETYFEEEVDFEEEITVPDPEKEGHEFIGWKDEDGNTVTFPMAAPSDDIVITPVFEKKTYTITFTDDDGTVISGPTDIEYGAAIVAPEAPEKDGYSFAYWQDADTNAVIPATMPAKNATYVAYYTAGDDTTYYIEVYMMDTNGDYTMASQTIATGTTGAPISITPGTVEGCTYDATLSELTGVITADGLATLKVYYARNIYTVTFNSGDGVFAEDATVVGPTNVYFGAAIPVPAEPTREGYDFTGWDTEVPATMPADNLTFNATWAEADYTITYVVNGTKSVVSYKFGATVETPADPVVAGMTFIKWDTAIPATMPAEDLIIIAEFEVAVYKATFLVDGVVYDQFMVGHGDEIPVPAEDPVKDFYVFTGWTNMPDDGRMPAVDIEITATFERVPVKLIPMEGSTTVIDADTKAIYGIGLYATEAILRSTYLDVEGDGYFTVAPSKKTACGTGTVIELYDNVTGELLETYTIVVYGDLNGDSKIGNDDYTIALAEYEMLTSWSDPVSAEYDFYKTMAADFDGDTMINIGEAASIERFVLGTVDIDQTTGEVIRVK